LTSFNQSETPTLQEFIELIGAQLQIKPKFYQFEFSDNDDDDGSGSEPELDEYYPSVEFGPIDISKALQSLSWKPTPLKRAVDDTCQFFQDAWTQYVSERRECTEDFSRQMMEMLHKIYGTQMDEEDEDDEDEEGEEDIDNNDDDDDEDLD
jgi:hypothetical protein